MLELKYNNKGRVVNMAFIKFKPLTSRYNFFNTINYTDFDDKIKEYLTIGEEVLIAFKSTRDLGVFTNKRILLIDVKGVKGVRKNIFTIQYSSISTYELDIKAFDSAINITTNSGYQTSLNFLKPIPLDDMFRVYHLINQYLLKDN